MSLEVDVVHTFLRYLYLYDVTLRSHRQGGRTRGIAHSLVDADLHRLSSRCRRRASRGLVQVNPANARRHLYLPGAVASDSKRLYRSGNILHRCGIGIELEVRTTQVQGSCGRCLSDGDLLLQSTIGNQCKRCLTVRLRLILVGTDNERTVTISLTRLYGQRITKVTGCKVLHPPVTVGRNIDHRCLVGCTYLNVATQHTKHFLGGFSGKFILRLTACQSCHNRQGDQYSDYILCLHIVIVFYFYTFLLLYLYIYNKM